MRSYRRSAAVVCALTVTGALVMPTAASAAAGQYSLDLTTVAFGTKSIGGTAMSIVTVTNTSPSALRIWDGSVPPAPFGANADPYYVSFGACYSNANPGIQT